MSILVTSPCPESTVEKLGINYWPIWPCDESSFNWTYEYKDTSPLLEGEVTVNSEVGKIMKFGAGDLVIFSAGLNYKWDVHKAVRKHYRIGD